LKIRKRSRNTRKILRFDWHIHTGWAKLNGANAVSFVAAAAAAAAVEFICNESTF